jgi:GntR family transcriptional regulator, transcriptional repressor for pyruvate dehydrogenase complex
MSRAMKSSEVVARDLARHIIENDMAEGTRLPSEKEMAASLGVGRSTLREALRLLETRGVISIRKGAGGGPVVRRPRTGDLSEALTLVLEFHGAVMQDVVEAREAMECLVVQFATGRITDEQLAQLADGAQRVREHADDAEIWLEETQRFHRIINEACGNIVIQTFNQAAHAVTNQLVRGMVHSSEHRRRVANAHERILAAMSRRDVAGAVEAMRAHVRESGQYWADAGGDLRRQSVRWTQL